MAAEGAAADCGWCEVAALMVQLAAKGGTKISWSALYQPTVFGQWFINVFGGRPKTGPDSAIDNAAISLLSSVNPVVRQFGGAIRLAEGLGYALSASSGPGRDYLNSATAKFATDVNFQFGTTAGPSYFNSLVQYVFSRNCTNAPCASVMQRDPTYRSWLANGWLRASDGYPLWRAQQNLPAAPQAPQQPAGTNCSASNYANMGPCGRYWYEVWSNTAWQCQQQTTTLQTQVNNLLGYATQLQNAAAALQAEVTSLTGYAHQLEAAIATLTQRLSSSSAALTACQQQTVSLTNYAHQLEASIATLTQRLTALQASFQTLQGQVSQLQSQHSTDTRKITQLNTQLTQVSNALHSAQQQLQQETALYQQCEARLKKLPACQPVKGCV